jgi:hypothetical protein
VTVRALVAKVATVVAAAVATAVLGACTGERPRGVSAPGDGAPASATDGPPRFQRLDAARTGVAFANTLPEAPDFNILNYLYYYNGGGVAVGDVDGDGLVDLYLSANLGPNRLYRNLGGFRFEEVTDRAGVAGPPGWKTGVMMADLTGDGHLDLVASGVDYLGMRGRTVVYVNDGTGRFADRTAALGLAFQGYATQALAFDYDRDGDLDLYLLNHSVHTERQIGVAARRDVRHPKAGDRLYRNEGGRFTDVSARAGIFGGVEGYGLGVASSDVDGDGCPDLYVANDFQENDFLYRNRCDGTFEEGLARGTARTSRFSMGVDAADVDNDGRPDLVVADMLPEREAIFKTSASYETFTLFDLRLRAGYHPQYPRNTLQRNLGAGRFAEVALQAGIAATDWSWAPLLADLDGDGRKDLFLTTGIVRRPNDLDYINYVGNEAVQASLARGITRENLALIARMPQVPLPSHAFRNTGGWQFTDMAAAWGLDDPGFATGAAYADLDNDGALDLVVNRVNAPVGVYRNRTRERPDAPHWLRLRLAGRGANRFGVGARVTVVAGGVRQLLEQQPVRGFQSSVDPRLHVGLGAAAVVDTLEVVWPDWRMQRLTAVAPDRELVLEQEAALLRWRPPVPAPPLAVDVAPALGAAVPHLENDVLDYAREPLMPHALSREGPALAVADVNGDGLDDLFVGGAKWQPATLLLQRPDGRFAAAPAPALAADSLHEDVDAAFADVDRDGDPDLVVASGGNEFFDDAPALLPRLYLNDGRGGFARREDLLPAGLHENWGTVAVGDLDGDGAPDLFLGGRVVSRRYGATPRSVLLRNDGRGRFADVTGAVAPALARAGMVAEARFVDVDADGRQDLVVAGEWMPVRLFRNDGRRLVEATGAAGFTGTEGWWQSVTVADVDGNGAPDLVLGNLGTNAWLRASARAPVRLYLADFGGTGTERAVLTHVREGREVPAHGRDDFVRLIPALRSRYPSYASFGASTLADLFGAEAVRAATVREARTFASMLALNDGRGRFTLRPLPPAAQVAPVYAALAADLVGNPLPDLWLAGNQSAVPPLFGRHDAGWGTLLRATGGGAFSVLEPGDGAPALAGDVRALHPLRHASGRRTVVVARSGAPLQILQWPAPPAR